MAEQPGVQGLHAAEIRNLDEFRMPRLRAHKATPQDQGTTVLAGAETIALLHYPGRRRQAEGGPPNVGRKRLASRRARTSRRAAGAGVRVGPADSRPVLSYLSELIPQLLTLIAAPRPGRPCLGFLGEAPVTVLPAHIPGTSVLRLAFTESHANEGNQASSVPRRDSARAQSGSWQTQGRFKQHCDGRKRCRTGGRPGR